MRADSLAPASVAGTGAVHSKKRSVGSHNRHPEKKGLLGITLSEGWPVGGHPY